MFEIALDQSELFSQLVAMTDVYVNKLDSGLIKLLDNMAPTRLCRRHVPTSTNKWLSNDAIAAKL